MKLKSFIRNLILCGGLVGAINYFSLPVIHYVHTNSLKKHIKDREIQKVCKTDSHLENIVAKDALHILGLAHIISTKYLTFEDWIIPSSKEKENALNGKADCSYFSAFTYSNFFYIADKLGKPELKNKVRLCSGQSGYYAHAWLQVYFNNKWNDYETTYILSGNVKYLPYEKVLNRHDNHSFSYIQLEKNKLVNHTDFLKSIKTGVDLKDLIIEYFF